MKGAFLVRIIPRQKGTLLFCEGHIDCATVLGNQSMFSGHKRGVSSLQSTARLLELAAVFLGSVLPGRRRTRILPAYREHERDIRNLRRPLLANNP